MAESLELPRPLEEMSVDELLRFAAENGKAIDPASTPEVDDLGAKGEKRFFVQQSGGGQIMLGSVALSKPLPDGAKEVSWEQACEFVIRFRVNADYAARCEQLAALVAEAGVLWHGLSEYGDTLAEREAAVLRDMEDFVTEAKRTATRLKPKKDHDVLNMLVAYNTRLASKAVGKFLLGEHK